jgi:hypothetical protein
VATVFRTAVRWPVWRELAAALALTAAPEAVGALAELQSGSDAIGYLGTDGLGVVP